MPPILLDRQMTKPLDKSRSSYEVIDDECLRFHHKIIAALYILALIAAYLVLNLPGAEKDLISLLSTGAILATFGSAIGAIGLIWQNDLLERVHLNIDILYRDIIQHETPWRRWPFLARSSRKTLLNNNSLQFSLGNPEIPLDVGTHVIRVHLPTIMEDFFDLPLLKNYWSLWRFQKAACTVLGQKRDDLVNPETGMTPFKNYMAYECMFDIWKSILRFRLSRYILHFSSGLTICGALITAIKTGMYFH